MFSIIIRQTLVVFCFSNILRNFIAQFKQMTSVVFIGAGNLATSVAINFWKSGFAINQVIANSKESAMRLAQKVGATYSNSLDELNARANLYVVAVPDSQIEPVLNELQPMNQMVVHTSGSTSIEVFDKKKFPAHGVFYPFQTFSKSRIVELKEVSICVEANSSTGLQALLDIAHAVSHKVVTMDSEQRRWLHLTGVFGSNFVNHILALTHQITTAKGIDFAIIEPLVKETVLKAFMGNPVDMQTGPAVRHDAETLSKHAQMLEDFNPELQKIYNELSLEIQKFAAAK